MGYAAWACKMRPTPLRIRANVTVSVALPSLQHFLANHVGVNEVLRKRSDIRHVERAAQPEPAGLDVAP